MIPPVPLVLGRIAERVMAELAPELATPYAAQTAELSAALLMMIAEEFDRAAARLAEENAALEALFRDARGVIPDESLRGEFDRELAAPEPGLRVSALHGRNQTLRGLLVRVHAVLEDTPGAEAAALVERIWEELAASVRRRALMLANG